MAQQDRERRGRRKHTFYKEVTGDGGEVTVASASWFLNVPVLDPGDTAVGGGLSRAYSALWREESQFCRPSPLWHFGSSGMSLAPSKNVAFVTCACTSFVPSVSLGLKQ